MSMKLFLSGALALAFVIIGAITGNTLVLVLGYMFYGGWMVVLFVPKFQDVNKRHKALMAELEEDSRKLAEHPRYLELQRQLDEHDLAYPSELIEHLQWVHDLRKKLSF